MVVPSSLRSTSPRRTKSPAHSKAPIKTPIDGHHVEVSDIVIVPSMLSHTSPRKAKSFGDVKALSLVLQNHFSSLDGLETIDVVSKFWADPNEMEEDANDTGEEIVCTKRKLGRPHKGQLMEIKPKRTWRPLIKLKKRWRHKWRTPMEVKVHLKGLQEACSKPWELEDIYFLFL